MATCNYIPAKKQTRGAMRAVIRYVSQDMKTLDERGHRYLTGINCLASAAVDEFMATKNLYGKRDGVMYYHYEQSFAPGEIDDYDTAHEIGLKLAGEMFPGFEVLVATHLDAYDDDCRQRVHNHFVINSVSIDTGLKLDMGPRTLEKMRRISDRLCKQRGLSVLPRYEQQFTVKGLGPREYRAATKVEFLSLMESLGYSVTWTDNRKYITYTCPNGMKVRDNKLHETKFLKENMEYESRRTNRTSTRSRAERQRIRRLSARQDFYVRRGRAEGYSRSDTAFRNRISAREFICRLPARTDLSVRAGIF